MARREETKVSFLTTEFWAMVGVIAALLVAAQQADNFDAPRAWTLVAAVAIGYMISRGLAKSGSDHRDRETTTPGSTEGRREPMAGSAQLLTATWASKVRVPRQRLAGNVGLGWRSSW